MDVKLNRVNKELTFDHLLIGDVFTVSGGEHVFVKVHLQRELPPINHPVRNAVSITGRVGIHFDPNAAVIKATSLTVEV